MNVTFSFQFMENEENIILRTPPALPVGNIRCLMINEKRIFFYEPSRYCGSIPLDPTKTADLIAIARDIIGDNWVEVFGYASIVLIFSEKEAGGIKKTLHSIGVEDNGNSYALYSFRFADIIYGAEKERCLSYCVAEDNPLFQDADAQGVLATFLRGMAQRSYSRFLELQRPSPLFLDGFDSFRDEMESRLGAD